MIGTDLDKYEVLRKIGEGGMATVYVARHRTLNRELAIKVLHPHLSSASRNRKRFAREARAIEHLRHPNILEIFDYSGPLAEDSYIVTEFVKGETLTQLMELQTRLPSEITSMIGIDLCNALAFAHKSSILHRDLKPENVMLREDGVIKLMDFGIARFLDESNVTMTGALIGSPAFMSPEQAKESDLDTRSDLFSLGTLLFYLCTGRLPFFGTNASLVLKKIIEGERPMVADAAPGVSGLLMEVIEGLLQSDRQDRFSDADEVRALLMESLSEVNIDPKSTEWSLHTWREDPTEYGQRLDLHLSTQLVSAGQDALANDKAISALRLFNRALSLNPEDAQVLTLVQSLHRPRRLPPLPVPFAIVAIILVFTAALLVWALSPQEESPTDTPAVASVQVEPINPLFGDEQADIIATPPSVATLSSVPPQPVPIPIEPSQPAAETITIIPATPAELIPDHPLTTIPPDNRGQATVVEAVLRLAELEIRTNLPADIWIGDTRMGHTRQPNPIQLIPGPHHVTLRNEWIEDYTLDVTLKPGEKFVPPTIITLTTKPTTISVPTIYSGSCVVFVNDIRLGTLVQLNHTILRPHASGPQRVRLVCEDIEHTATFKNLAKTRRETFPNP